MQETTPNDLHFELEPEPENDKGPRNRRERRAWTRLKGSTRKSPRSSTRKYPETALFTLPLTSDQVTALALFEADTITAVVEGHGEVRLRRSGRVVGHITKAKATVERVELELSIDGARTIELMARHMITAEDICFTNEEGA